MRGVGALPTVLISRSLGTLGTAAEYLLEGFSRDVECTVPVVPGYGVLSRRIFWWRELFESSVFAADLRGNSEQCTSSFSPGEMWR